MTAKAPLVVVGDALLDVDVDGSATRLCPDAPVPVLDTHDERARPGGAGPGRAYPLPGRAAARLTPNEALKLSSTPGRPSAPATAVVRTRSAPRWLAA